MARPSKPWYWKARDAWCVTLRGKRHVLAKGKSNRTAAYREYLRLADRQNPEVATKGSAMQVCELFLVYARAIPYAAMSETSLNCWKLSVI